MTRISYSDKRIIWITSIIIGITIGGTALVHAIFIKTPLVFKIDALFFLSLMIALFPSAVIEILDSRWKNAVDDAIPKFLRGLSEAGRTGVTLTRAIELASKRRYGPLSDELNQVITQMSWGVSLDDALTKFADRVETRLARRTSFILSEIQRGGGDIREILETVSHHIGELQTIDRERQTQIKPYIAIVYVAFLIFLVIDILLIKTFFSEMESMKTLMTESGGSLLSAGIEVSKITQIMFHITMFEGFFGGLVAGKMGENYINAGLKHSLILMIIGFLSFYLMVWTSIIPI